MCVCQNVVLGFTNPDYENIRMLNRGGIGDVFVAHKKGMNIDVVIKRTQVRYQHGFNQENEAMILKSLKHQYLPRIYDVLYGNDGCVYTVMDLISGQNLQQYVERNGPATQKKCYRWACQLCEVVRYLHEENRDKPAIIHCDIKPGNVMITNSGDICLIDFNTSLIFRGDKKSVAVTDGYAAPEQYTTTADQSGYGPISMATDIYAIGATLYFAVTGHRPQKSLENVIPLERYKPKISRSMLTIIVRAMQKQQKRRFQQASEMLRALKNVDRMDRRFKSCQAQKRVIALLLAICFASSAYSCYYGAGLMQSERENVYLVNLSEAEQAEQNADYDTAQMLLNDAIRQQPGRADAYLQMSTLLYRMGDYQGAIDKLDNATVSGSLSEKNMDRASSMKLHFIKGNCYIALKDYENAVTELQTAAALPGAGSEIYRSLAIALANAGNLDEAQKAMEELQVQGACSGDCDLVAAEIQALQKNYDRALTLYDKVFDEVDDPQLLSHAYLSAADTALNKGDTVEAVRILRQGCRVLSDAQAVLQKEMLADLMIQQAASDTENAEECYIEAQQLLEELVNSGYGTIATQLNLATVLQARDQYGDAEKVLKSLQEQYPSDYRVDMQLAYLLIDWQGAKPVEQRNYLRAENCYASAVEKYRQAQANGTEDAQMAVLKNLLDQLRSGGWLK